MLNCYKVFFLTWLWSLLFNPSHGSLKDKEFCLLTSTVGFFNNVLHRLCKSHVQHSVDFINDHMSKSQKLLVTPSHQYRHVELLSVAQHLHVHVSCNHQKWNNVNKWMCTYFNWVRSRVPLTMWSMILPGVPMTASSPFFIAVADK